MAVGAAGARGDAEVGAVSPPPLPLHHVTLVERLCAANAAMMQDCPTPFLRVRQRVAKWQEIGASATLLEVIRSGLRIPLEGVPGPCPPRATGPIRPELERLLEMGVARLLPAHLVESTRAWTPAFGVLKPSGKIRLITDLRALNACTHVPRFRAEGMATVQVALAQGIYRWGAKLDLADAFFHIGLAPMASRWVRVTADGLAIELMGMPFGLALSPYWCQRLCRPVAAHLRHLGIPLIWYVDDLLILGKTPEQVVWALQVVIKLFNDLGLGISESKCVFAPSQQLEYLGLKLDLASNLISLPEEKQAGLKKSLKRLAKQTKAPPTAVAAVAGQMQYSAQGHGALHGLGKVAMAAAGTMAATNPHSKGRSTTARWSTPTDLSLALKKVFTFAAEALTMEEPLPVHDEARPPTVVIYSDASDDGWGAVFKELKASTTTQRPSTRTTAGRWTPNQRALHITKKEALAAGHALLAFRPYVDENDAVLLRTDSVATRAALSKGSARAALNWCAHNARREYFKSRIQLRVEYVRSADNVADAPSRRGRNRNDYKLHPRVFKAATAQLQYKPQVDLFASLANRSCRRFFSRTPEPGAEGENALDHRWTYLPKPYANPPWPLLGAVLNKVRRDEVKELLLVAPVWRGASWWPTLEAMTVAAMEVSRSEPVYLRDGVEVPPPRWTTTIRVISSRTTGSS